MCLDKLGLSGICSPLIDWVADLLIGLFMRFSGIRSNFMDVRSRVPQRSVLGPLLFLLFVNYLPTYVVSKCKFFLRMI